MKINKKLEEILKKGINFYFKVIESTFIKTVSLYVFQIIIMFCVAAFPFIFIEIILEIIINKLTYRICNELLSYYPLDAGFFYIMVVILLCAIYYFLQLVVIIFEYISLNYLIPVYKDLFIDILKLFKMCDIYFTKFVINIINGKIKLLGITKNTLYYSMFSYIFIGGVILYPFLLKYLKLIVNFINIYIHYNIHCTIATIFFIIFITYVLFILITAVIDVCIELWKI